MDMATGMLSRKLPAERNALESELVDLRERVFGLEFTLEAIRRFNRCGDQGRVDSLVEIALERDVDLRARMAS